MVDLRSWHLFHGGFFSHMPSRFLAETCLPAASVRGYLETYRSPDRTPRQEALARCLLFGVCSFSSKNTWRLLPRGSRPSGLCTRRSKIVASTPTENGRMWIRRMRCSTRNAFTCAPTPCNTGKYLVKTSLVSHSAPTTLSNVGNTFEARRA